MADPIHNTFKGPGTGAEVGWDHAIWLRAVPLLRAKINECNLTGESRTAPGFSPQPLTAVGAGTQLANFLRYFTQQFALLGRTYDKYSIQLQQWGVPNEVNFFGDPPNCPAGCQNWRDKVVVPDGDEQRSCQSLYSGQARPILKSWGEIALGTLDTLRISNGDAQPLEMHQDMEKDVETGSFCNTAGNGTWVPHTADLSRWDVELIDGISTLADLFAAGRDINGDPLTVNPNQQMGHITNRRFHEWLDGLRQADGEFILQDCLYSIARGLWDNLPCSNFAYIASTANHPHPGLPHWRNDFNRTLRYSDMQHVTLYPLSNTAFTVTSTYELQLERFGVTPTYDYQADLDQVYINRARMQMQNCKLANPTLRCMPSLPSPGFTNVIEDLHLNGAAAAVSFTHVLHDDVIREVMRNFIPSHLPPRYYWWQHEQMLESDYTKLDTLMNFANQRHQQVTAQLADPEEWPGTISVQTPVSDRIVGSGKMSDRIVLHL